MVVLVLVGLGQVLGFVVRVGVTKLEPRVLRYYSRALTRTPRPPHQKAQPWLRGNAGAPLCMGWATGQLTLCRTWANPNLAAKASW